MIRGKIARRLLSLFIVVTLLPLIFIGIRFNIDSYVLTIYAFYAIFITMIIALFLLRGIIGPIKKLIEGTTRLAGGDLDFRVSIPSRDEFGQLASSFNDMAASLKKKQETLRVTADYLKTVLDNLPDEVVVIDRDYRITDVNAATLLIEGYKRVEDIVGRHCYEILHRSEVPCTEFRGICPVRTVFETGRSAMTAHLHYDREGNGHYVEIAASPIRDSEGKIIAAIEVLRDITEKKEKEEKILRQSRELMALNSISTLALTTRDKEEILGHTLDRILEVTELDAGWISLLSENGKGIYLLAHKGLSDAFVSEESMPSLCGCVCEDVFVTGEPVSAEMLGCKRVRKETIEKEGLRRHISVPMRTKEGIIGMMNLASIQERIFTPEEVSFFVSIANTTATALENIDLYINLKKRIEELKSTQDQLIRSAKLAAIGELAANIAHEINNPLTGVLGYATLMLSSPDTSPSQREMLEVIEKETIRARATVRNLLDFSRPKALIKEKGDIVDAIKGAIVLIKKLLEIANINLIQDYAEGLPLVEIDMDQMKQVFLNLLNNALQAMPKGGTLTLRTSYRKLEDVIIVEVMDTGSGISEEDLKRIFDPFFTTREEEGSGLGLSISYRIIESHGGRIEAESEIGKGSIFRVVLPKAK